MCERRIQELLGEAHMKFIEVVQEAHKRLDSSLWAQAVLRRGNGHLWCPLKAEESRCDGALQHLPETCTVNFRLSNRTVCVQQDML